MKNKKQYAWKVVRVVNEKRYSVIGLSSRVVQYKINRWTTPLPGFPALFVFSTRKHARNFKNRQSNIARIFKCEVKCVRTFDFRLGDVESWPTGTLFAPAVKILK